MHFGRLNFQPAAAAGTLLAAVCFYAALGSSLAVPQALCALQEDAVSDGQLLQQAVELRQQGRFDEAEELLSEASRRDPANPDYHFELGNTYAAAYDAWQGKLNSPRRQTILRSCERELKQAVMFRPGFSAARYNLGVILKRQGRNEEAREEFRRILEIQPDMPAAYYQIGETYESQGFYDEAEDAYQQARQRSPGAPEIEEALMRVRQERSQPTASERQSGFERAALLNQFNAQGGGSGMFGSSQQGMGGSPFGNSYANPNQQQNQSGALSSLASVMLQQMMARRSFNDNNQ